MTEATQGGARPHLIFEGAGERFALEATHVEEIIPSRPVLPVPRAPVFIAGIINLRGRIVTLLSLRLLGRGLGESSAAEIVVLAMPGADLGFGVDRVIGIYGLDSPAARESPHEEDHEQSLAKGVVQHDGFPVTIIDAEKLLSFIFSYAYQTKV